jgi:gamma-glutamyl-gamma-aminobutyraldehyde dehydrogenase
MADARDLDLVADNIVLAGYANMGENCTCGSRVIVHRSLQDALLERIVARTADWTVGNPQDPATRIGPMIEAPHLDKVLGYIQSGRDDGARVLVGGGRALPESGGYFVEPTIFDGVDNSMKIAREEIFGPVISTMAFDDEDEGLAIANDTNYGLHAAVYTNDLDTAIRAARTLQAGTVSVNAYSEGDITTPFGGYKESGFGGRDGGFEAFDQYTEKKTVWIQLKP